MEERIIEIETKVAYQEDLLQSLNDIVAKQQATIDEISVQYKKLKDQFKNIAHSQSDGGDIDDELPPHY